MTIFHDTGIEPLLQPLEEAIRHQFLPAETGRQWITDLGRDLLALYQCGMVALVYRSQLEMPTTSLRPAQKWPLPSWISFVNGIPITPSSRSKSRGKWSLHSAQGTEEKPPKRLSYWSPNYQGLGKGQWNRPAKKVPLHGSQPPPCPNTASTITNRLSEMPSALGLGTSTRLATHCQCEQPFSVSHAFSCPKGAMPSIRHNAIRDITAQRLTEVCPNVCVEPTLQPLTGERFPLRSTNIEEGACKTWHQDPKFLGQKQTIILFLIPESSSPMHQQIVHPPPMLATEAVA